MEFNSVSPNLLQQLTLSNRIRDLSFRGAHSPGPHNLWIADRPNEVNTPPSANLFLSGGVRSI